MRMALQEVGSSLHVFNNPSAGRPFWSSWWPWWMSCTPTRYRPRALCPGAGCPGPGGGTSCGMWRCCTPPDARLRSGGRDARSRAQKLRDALPQASYLQGKDVYFDGFSILTKRRRDPPYSAYPGRERHCHFVGGSVCHGDLPKCTAAAAAPGAYGAADGMPLYHGSLWSRRGTRPWPIWKNTFSAPRRPPARVVATR